MEDKDSLGVGSAFARNRVRSMEGNSGASEKHSSAGDVSRNTHFFFYEELSARLDLERRFVQKESEARVERIHCFARFLNIFYHFH